MGVILAFPITRIPISTGGSDDPSTKFCEVMTMDNIQQFLNEQLEVRQRVCYVCRETIYFNIEDVYSKRLDSNTWQPDKNNGELRYRHNWHGERGCASYTLEKPKPPVDQGRSIFIRRRK